MKNFFLNAKLSNSLFIAISASLIISIVLRNPFYSVALGGDTKGLGGYIQNYNRIIDWDSLRVIYYYNDYLFSTFSYLFWSLQVPVKIYLLILEIISTLFLFLAYKNIIFCHYKNDVFLSNQSSYSYKSSYLIFLTSLILILCSSSFYLFAVNALRQFLAISIFLYGISIWFNNKPKLGSVILFLSIFAHTSSIFLVGCFYISMLFSQRALFAIFAIVISVKLLISGSFFNDLVLSNSDYIDQFSFLSRLIDYINYKISVLSAKSTGIISVNIKLFHAIYFALFIFFVSSIKQDYVFKSLVKLYLVFVFFCYFISSFEAMTNRFLLYTGLIEPLLIAYSIFSIKKSQRVSVAFIVNSLALFYLSIVLLFHPSLRGELMLNPEPIGGYKHGLPDPNFGKFINPTW